MILLLALLICDTAAGLASGLAGSLAFAAAAIFGALTQIAGFDGLNVFHNGNLHIKKFAIILTYSEIKVNTAYGNSVKNHTGEQTAGSSSGWS